METLAAAVGYWLYAYWTRSHSHLLLLISIVPLLLLRSKESVALGIKWFHRYDVWVWNRSPALVRPVCFNLGVGYALLVRIAATAFHPWRGFQSLSENWWRTLFATDMFTKPEVIPGYKPEGNSLYEINAHLRTIRGVEVPKVNNPILQKLLNASNIVMDWVIPVGFFAPAYFYRISIKSTVWVHWPIAYISRPLKFAYRPEQIHQRLWRDPREWLRRVVMVFTLAGTLVASVPGTHLTEFFPQGVINFVEYAFLVDIRALVSQPWRVAMLGGALITLLLTWYGWELSLLLGDSAMHDQADAAAQRWATLFEYLMRIRDVCGWVFWALVFGHAILWLVPTTNWIQGYPRELLQVIYGEFLPPSLRS